MAGCGSNQIQVEITPTPAATPTPTPAPATPTPTPLPTATPAPRLIGTKTADSKCIYLTNNTQKVLRRLYVKVSGAEDWGKSLIPNESSVKSAEQVRMYYTPQGEGITYDMRFVDGDGSTYEIYSVNLSDMERASLKKDEEQGLYYLSYMSVSQKSERETKDNYTSSYGSDSSDSDMEYYDDYSDWNESYYEESYYDESYYDDSSDDSDYYYDSDEDDGSYDNSDGEIVWNEDGDWN